MFLGKKGLCRIRHFDLQHELKKLESEQPKASQPLLHCGVRLPSRILVPDHDHRWKERAERADSMMGPRQSWAILAPLYPAQFHLQIKSKQYVPHTVLPSPKHPSHYGLAAAHCCYPRPPDTETPCNLQTARTTEPSSARPAAGLQQPRATADSEVHGPDSADVREALLLEGPHGTAGGMTPERRSHRGGEGQAGKRRSGEGREQLPYDRCSSSQSPYMLVKTAFFSFYKVNIIFTVAINYKAIYVRQKTETLH